MTEEWRPIPPVPHYEASSSGKIRSLDRLRPTLNRWGQIIDRFHHGRILRLKPKPNGTGGIYFCFYSDGGVYWQVNRAVCWTFHGQPPTESHEAAHLNGNSQDDRASNLIWATRLENASHKTIHGTNPLGSRNAMAILTEADIPVIIEKYAGGKSSAALGEIYGVGPTTILTVIRGVAWSHVFSKHRDAAKAQALFNMQGHPDAWVKNRAMAARKDSPL